MDGLTAGSPIDRAPRAGAARIACILLAILALSAVLRPGWDTGFTICLFKTLTAHPCPGCGMTHAFVWLAHGRLSEAMAANALSPLVFAVVVAAALRSLAVALGGAGTAWPRLPHAVYVAGLALVMAWWGIRLYLGI